MMRCPTKQAGKGLYVRVDTVMNDLQISKPMAYRMIAEWNSELKDQGYTTISGRVPEAYYKKKIYGMTDK